MGKVYRDDGRAPGRTIDPVQGGVPLGKGVGIHPVSAAGMPRLWIMIPYAVMP